MNSPGDIEKPKPQQQDEGSENNTSKNSISKQSMQSSTTPISLSVDASVMEMISRHKDEPREEEDPNKRQTQLYCVSCCDILMASLVVDCLYVPWMINSVLINLGLYQDAMELTEDTRSDRYYDGSEDVDPAQTKYQLLALKNVIGVMFGIIGILGTCRQYRYLVLATGLWFCVDLVWSCVHGRYIMLVLVFNIYPHFFLFDALRKGKITRENYKRREKHCCWNRKVSENDD